jgi:hypothetical protein
MKKYTKRKRKRREQADIDIYEWNDIGIAQGKLPM